ncbi:hypothetical protein Bca52824_081949 [Brassica carinata]|uniref:RING-type E3 ubiquitin transferase n=1 Tax=Brassica carinata TaxID=52824 RepID=A0A8X7PJL7_BRACI|nr:hypothetical protein Bca52824_081949 [Brassica carinata]
MEQASSDESCPSNIHLRNRQRTKDNIRSATVDVDVLDCPVCFEQLTIPIFQCDNRHMVCSSCCSKLRDIFPTCASPIGHIRCRGTETVIESVFLPCINAELGCAEKVSFLKESTHKKECSFSLCSCPVQDCNYTGSYTDLYDHYAIYTHQDSMGRGEPYGVYVTISCIVPSSPEVGNTMTYESPDVKKTLQVNLETPLENSMLIPHCSLSGDLLDLRLCIKKLN